MWVKICGITRLEDALLAEELGADAIGFVFASSPRQIDVSTAARIGECLRRVSKVGVFVDPELSQVQEITKRCDLDIVQLHGKESAAFCQAVGGTVVKALRLKDETTLEKIRDYSEVWKILLDSYVPGKLGGTGQPINAEYLRKVDDFTRVILAGGLCPENVEAVLREFEPFGIDVSSGVEQSPGIKDPYKLEQLLNAVKRRG